MSQSDVTPWVADALVLLGVAVMTIGVFGIYRMPDVATKLHAASKAVFLGAIVLCAATLVTGQAAIIYRVLLIAGLLLLTTPVASHVIGRAAYLDGEMEAAGESTPESGEVRHPRART
ncbi:MAG: monovalent cation/H(+) antiporter subunit G [Thermomicrobiales bacterium]